LDTRKVEENKRRKGWKVRKVFGEKQKSQMRGHARASSRRIRKGEGSEWERKVKKGEREK
jgi:hypothetical protein